jgi:hypothetical protein
MLMKATVLAESSSYFIFSPGYLRYCDVYRCESVRCHTLPFFLTFFLSNSVYVYVFLVIHTHQALVGIYFFFIAGTYLGKCAHVLASSLVGVNKTNMKIFSGIIFTFINCKREDISVQ